MAGAAGADGNRAPAVSRETLSADDVDPMSADPTPLTPEPARDDVPPADDPGDAAAPEATDR